MSFIEKIVIKKICIVIPCYKVSKHIITVLRNLPLNNINHIYVVDDDCPEFSGKIVENYILEKNIKNIAVLKNQKNLGVGGATKRGYVEALKDNNDIIIKIDGDDQMDPNKIDNLLKPLLNGEFDFAKGNRFFNLNDVKKMPKIRIFGNVLLSFFCKLSTGYWNTFDPTNGFTAINSKIVKLIPLGKVSNNFFFEMDLLFRLSILRAKIVDIPMEAIYKNEKSNLKVNVIILPFLKMLFLNFLKRIFYNYYLRNFTIASIELPLGFIMFFSGLIYGLINYKKYLFLNLPTPLGIIMLAMLLITIGFQLLLNFLNYDINSSPKECLNKYL